MNEKVTFSKRVGLQQRVIPEYRLAFLEHFGEACFGGLSVIAGEPRLDESIVTAAQIPNAEFVRTKNRHILSGKFYLCAQTGLLTWLRTWDPEVLILEANFRYPANRRAITWMQRRNRPVIGWGLGTRKDRGFLSGFLNRLRENYLNSFDALIAYSSAGVAQFVAAGIPRDKVFLAINSILPPIDRLPERTSWESRKPRVLYVGRLQARKRLDVLIRACAALETKPELRIVGAGPEEKNLKTLANEILPDTKFPGFLQGGELVANFKSADIFVLPGTGGLAVQQAMVYGLPIVIGEGDGTQLDLVSEKNGWHITPGDIDDLVRVLNESLADGSRLKKMGEASFKIVQDRANVEKMVEVFVQAMEYATREVR